MLWPEEILFTCIAWTAESCLFVLCIIDKASGALLHQQTALCQQCTCCEERKVHTRAGFSCMACLVLIRGLHYNLVRLDICTIHM